MSDCLSHYMQFVCKLVLRKVNFETQKNELLNENEVRNWDYRFCQGLYWITQSILDGISLRL